MTETQARRFARHPLQRSERVATGNQRITWLGDPDHQPMHQAPSQRTAHELIAAEHRLAEAQSRYLAAHRDWTKRARSEGLDLSNAQDAASAKAELDTAEAARDLAMRHIDELRRQLHAQRHAELATANSTIDASADVYVHRHGAHDSRDPTSWFNRLLGRAGG